MICNLFIYIWLRGVFSAALGFSRWGAQAYPCGGYSCCRAQALGTQASAVLAVHRLSGPATCGIFWTRDRTRAPRTGRQIQTHCSTRGAKSTVVIHANGIPRKELGAPPYTHASQSSRHPDRSSRRRRPAILQLGAQGRRHNRLAQALPPVRGGNQPMMA